MFGLVWHICYRDLIIRKSLSGCHMQDIKFLPEGTANYSEYLLIRCNSFSKNIVD